MREDLLSILVVEDDHFVSEYIKTLLESFVQATVNIVSSGEDALNQVSLNKPDLILMDILLDGEIDGIETARRIHANYDIPLIYLTAHDDKQFLERAKITNPFGYMIKPIEPREFEAVITIALQQYQHQNVLAHDSYITKSLKRIYHPLIITDKDGHITSINEAASGLLGLSEKNALTHSYDTFLKIDIQNRKMNFSEEIFKASRNDGLYKEEDGVTLHLPNGGAIPISLTLSLVENDENEIEGICVMIVDLTQQTIEKNILHKKQLEASDLLISEQRLKEILDIGKDITQALIYDTPIKERLNFAVNRMVQFSNFKIAHIALVHEGKLKTFTSSKNAFLYLSHPDEIPRTDPFLERLYRTFEGKEIDLWEKREGSTPSLFNHRAEHIPIQSMLMLPLYSPASKVPLGVMSIASSTEQTFDIDTINYFEEFSNDISLAITLQSHREEIDDLKYHRECNYEQTILAFVQTVEERDIYTRGHSERVADYAKAIAHKMGYDDAECMRLHRAAILHDIGKIHTPDKILLKPDNLSTNEYTMVQEHVTASVRMLQPIAMYHDILDIIAQHHERYNGRGYPKGLEKEEIDPLARILSVADAFDAMTSNRIYRKRMSTTDALNELRKYSGQQFAPDVVEAAIEIFSLVPIIDDDSQNISELERERMAYYYRDTLTHLYNEEYLLYYIQNFNEIIQKQSVCVWHISGFNNYNDTEGWCSGNEKLKAVGKVFALLEDHYSTLCFRVHGNRFLIFSDHTIDKKMIQKKLDTVLETTNLKANRQTYKVNTLFRENQSDDLNQIIHELIC